MSPPPPPPREPSPLASAPADGLWLGIGELADRCGRDKATISRRVARLEADGVLAARKGLRGTKLINVAAFDRASGAAGDACRRLAEKSPAVAERITASERARREAYKADVALLDLAERRGDLISTDDIVAAAAACADVVRRAVMARLPTHADALAAAVTQDGPQGARASLDGLAQDLMASIEAEMAALANGAAPVGGRAGGE